jgi:hypothetical protein
VGDGRCVGYGGLGGDAQSLDQIAQQSAFATM